MLCCVVLCYGCTLLTELNAGLFVLHASYQASQLCLFPDEYVRGKTATSLSVMTLKLQAELYITGIQMGHYEDLWHSRLGLTCSLQFSISQFDFQEKTNRRSRQPTASECPSVLKCSGTPFLFH